MNGLLRASCLVALATVFQSHPAFAADSPARPSLRIIMAGGSATTTERLMTRLARTWTSLDATIVTTVTPKMSIRDVLATSLDGDRARVWIDLRDAHVATVFVVEGGNVFQRKIEFEPGFDDVALELLDVVTTSAVQEVLAGGHLGVTREAFSESQISAAAPIGDEASGPREVGSSAIGLGAAWLIGVTYEAAMFGSNEIAHGPGLEAQVQWKKLRLGVELRGRFANRVADDTLSLAPEGIRLAVGRVFSPGGNWACVVSLAAGLDATRVRSTSTDSKIANRSPFWSLTPVLSPLVRLEYLSRPLRVAALLGLDLDFQSSSYVVATSQSATPVWAPWRVRPVAEAALSHDF